MRRYGTLLGKNTVPKKKLNMPLCKKKLGNKFKWEINPHIIFTLLTYLKQWLLVFLNQFLLSLEKTLKMIIKRRRRLFTLNRSWFPN
jgi:hypothetical protein